MAQVTIKAAQRILGYEPGDEVTREDTPFLRKLISDGRFIVLAEHPDSEVSQADDAPGGEPPRTGKGSGRDAWRAYLAAAGTTFPDDADRDTLIALWDSVIDPGPDAA